MRLPLKLTSAKGIITTLETYKPPLRRYELPLGLVPVVLELKTGDVAFYRFLYSEIGRPYHWVSRALQTDEALRETLSADTTKVYIAYLNGEPAALCEIDHSEQEVPQIVHFGLRQSWHGRGIGKYLLSHFLHGLWQDQKVMRIKVTTCSFDHPAALRLYQRLGFEPVSQVEKELQIYAD